MKGNGIRSIIAANCDVLPPPKDCSQGEDSACLDLTTTCGKHTLSSQALLLETPYKCREGSVFALKTDPASL